MSSNSTMYSLHDTSSNPVNNWLRKDFFSFGNTAGIATSNATTEILPLYRLFLSGNGNQIVDVRDRVDATLVIFTDITFTPVESNSRTVSINAKVTIVHPLGPLHTASIPGYKHWIKVSIVKTSRVISTVSAGLAKTFFKDNAGSVQILYDAAKEASDGRDEITRQFALSIMNDARSSLPTIASPDTQQQQSVFTLIHVSNYAKKFELISNEEDTLENEKVPDTQAKCTNPSNIVQCYSDCTYDDKLEQHWKLLEQYASQNGCSIVHKKDYEHVLNKPVDVESDSKQVYFAGSNAIHVFQSSSTPQQCILEIVCMLKVNTKQHIGHIHQLIKDDNDSDEIIGFIMPKYDMTLENYLKQRQLSHLTSFQRMDLILQMTKSVKALYEQGVAHRNLSLDSFVVNFTNDTLLDGSPKMHLYLIHFANAVLFTPQDTKTWWINQSIATVDVLTVWCKNLPYVMARPDHRHLLNRSIQTLPKTRADHAILPYLINAPAEDVYSLGTLMWHIFSGTQAWPGLAHSDLKKLRKTVRSDAHIGRMIDMEIHGPIGSTLLKKILRVEPEERLSAAQVLEYIESRPMRDLLRLEWSSSILYTETISQPILDETSKHACNRAAASGDMNAESKSKQAEEEAVPSEPKRPKKYYVPTGRPVGRPRKKVRPKPPGRPKGSKNKVYYFVTEEEEKKRLEAENAEREDAAAVNQATTDINDMTPIRAAPDTSNTLTSTKVNATVQLEPTAITPSVFRTDVLPNVTTGTLAEADIQEILS